MAALLARGANGEVIRKAGVMGVVIVGGVVACDDPIRVELPAGPRLPQERV